MLCPAAAPVTMMKMCGARASVRDQPGERRTADADQVRQVALLAQVDVEIGDFPALHQHDDEQRRDQDAQGDGEGCPQPGGAFTDLGGRHHGPAGGQDRRAGCARNPAGHAPAAG